MRTILNVNFSIAPGRPLRNDCVLCLKHSTGGGVVNDRIIRHRRSTPCAVCGGYDEMHRGQGVRCFGFTSGDGQYAHCTRSEMAGALDPDPSGTTFPHRLMGTCTCGVEHGTYTPPHYPSTARVEPKRAADEDHYHTKRQPDVVYDYGEMQVCRVGNGAEKRIWQRRPCPIHGDKWLGDLDGIEPHLYRRDELLAAGPGAIVFVCEGEKAVEACRERGLLATCSPMGAGKWRDAYSADLAGMDVIILPDNDDVGRTHAEQVAASLHGIAASVRIVGLPGLPEKGDAFDYFAAGGTVEQVYQVALRTPVWTPTERETPNAFPDHDEHCAQLERDLAAAQRTLETQRQALGIALLERDAARADTAAFWAAIERGGPTATTIIATARALAERYRDEVSPGDSVKVYLPRIAELAGKSAKRVSLHLDRLADRGGILKETLSEQSQVIDRETGEISHKPQNRTFLTATTTARSFSGILTYFTTLPDAPAEPKRGGKQTPRPKQVCPACGAWVATTLHAHCGDCGHDYGPIEPAERTDTLWGRNDPIGDEVVVPSEETRCGRNDPIGDTPAEEEAAVYARLIARGQPPAQAEAPPPPRGRCAHCGHDAWLLGQQGICQRCARDASRVYTTAGAAGGD